MGFPRPFHVWLLVLSTAVSALHFRESSSYGTLVPRAGPYEPFRGGDDPSYPEPYEREPMFPVVPPEQVENVYQVHWQASFHSLEVHYRVDENRQPTDEGLEVGFRYDIRNGMIQLHFSPPNNPRDIQEGAALPFGRMLVYRIPGYDGIRSSQRSVILPIDINPQVIPDAVRQGNAHIETFIRQFVRPPALQASPRDYAWQLMTGLQSRAAAITRPQYRWLSLQMTAALARSRARDALKRKRDQVSMDRRSIRERDTLGSIHEQTGQSSQNTISEQSANFQTTLDMYNALLSNITTLLFPVLNELIDNSTNPILYQMAISIYADITMIPQQLVGPFKNGMTAFTDIEDQYLNKTNTKISSNGTIEYSASANKTEILYMLAYHGLYEKVYLSTWDKAINATNSTGLLNILSKLSGYILPADPSIAPSGWMDTPMSFLNSSADMQDIIRYANITQL